MHMSDALVSPAVGGAMWGVAVGVAAWSARKLRQAPEDGRVPLMGVLGAFVFAAQMVTFAIPATGSSGHLGGGVLLAIILGPGAAFLVMASVLMVQALLFADGGLLALGCNIVNLGFFASFLAYPFVFRPVAGARPTPRRLFGASLAACVVGLQLGALGVVVETALSGVSELRFASFLLLMQPIHLAIGIVEGLVTGAVVVFLRRARADLPLGTALAPEAGRPRSRRAALVAVGLVAMLGAGVLSWFASSRPDGLEWSLARLAGGRTPVVPDTGLRRALARAQAAMALLPEYGLEKNAAGGRESRPRSWPAVDAGTSTAGLVGALLTLALSGAVGAGLRAVRRSAPASRAPSLRSRQDVT